MKYFLVYLFIIGSVFAENVDTFKDVSFTYLTKENISRAESSKFAVIDFYAEWCHPCKKFSPIFNDTAKEMYHQYSFFKVNIDSERDLAKKFKVSSVPVTIYLKDGKEVTREVGYMSKDAFQSKIKKAFQ
jgi:thioredoxin 1